MNSFFFFSSELIVNRILIVSIVVNKIFHLHTKMSAIWLVESCQIIPNIVHKRKIECRKLKLVQKRWWLTGRQSYKSAACKKKIADQFEDCNSNLIESLNENVKTKTLNKAMAENFWRYWAQQKGHDQKLKAMNWRRRSSKSSRIVLEQCVKKTAKTASVTVFASWSLQLTYT